MLKKWLLLVFFYQPFAYSAQIYLASSLSEPIGKLFNSADYAVTLVPGPSSSLARQIVQGAPADLYISAHPSWTTYVTEHTSALKVERFLTNKLVVIKGNKVENDELTLKEMLGGSHGLVAVADPSHVPAGLYTDQVRRSLELSPVSEWVPARHVRQALRYVETGATPYGVVYSTDAKHSDNVNVVLQIDASLHQAIEYHIVSFTEKGNELAHFLMREESKMVLMDYGFELP
ncbi:molybdate ABC transporter substrate-binding protein [Thaumasiovibrio subtropicus]|uniref:molybdate ABC transporter substrate-binding protein n=1 Tax=Thaumasiovibrio subtropicus TaxID=1891207 RepID=UPI000B35F540|nr:molybdate ABC transporter substrate-binding protein [Thaumasiovibrio subtropicus]